MAEAQRLQVYSIAAHRGFADALVAGLIPRYADRDLGLARLTLLLPSSRAIRTVTEAFVRLSGAGMLLPRMAAVGDLDLDETLGPLLDPLGAGAVVPPAADPTRRWLRLAQLLGEVMGDRTPKAAGLLQLAFETGRTMDRLAIEGIEFENLIEERIAGIVGEQSRHWIDSTRDFATVLARWQAELAARGEVDAPVRRNLLFDHAARRWLAEAPAGSVVAAGVTSASPALARLLKVIAGLPSSAVILPDLDLSLEAGVWDALGSAGIPAGDGEPPIGASDATTHPQYHLKLLLNRMGVAKGEVDPWHRAGLAAAPPERSRAISNLFLPPSASARWVDLPAGERRLSGVRMMQSAHPGEEAQAIAILLREALEVPERRAALVTPDRGLAARVIAHLRRWDIVADDSAGVPLPQTSPGRVLLLLAEVLATQAAPVPLLALLVHPLVGSGDGRPDWLDHARALDLALRGPRRVPGLGAIGEIVSGLDKAELQQWWQDVAAVLEPLLAWEGERPLGEALQGLAAAAEGLAGEALWSGSAGRELSAWLEDLRTAAVEIGTKVMPADLPAVLRGAMDRVAVRPVWGGHPRLSIYGLLEARMSRADLVICAGLAEGTWPGSPSPEPLLPPAVLRALGVPGADHRIGLAAHDLAGQLGAPEVVLSWAARDEGGPVIPSRFVLRVEAMLGELAKDHREVEAIALARRIDRANPAPAYPRPEPRPTAAQRDVALAVTAIDRLRSDPYQFYASAILRLRSLDPLDAEPTAAWKGQVVHKVLERWHRSGGCAGELLAIASEELDQMRAHPLVRSLWWPRLQRGLEWIDAEIGALAADGRQPVKSEYDGQITFDGVKVHGRIDRLDRMPDGRLAVVDYKTGQAPSNTMVEAGFALQLGTLGLIAERGGFPGIAGEAAAFEYWSLAKSDKSATQFGKRTSPIAGELGRTGVPFEDFLDLTAGYLTDAIDRWIKGDEAFTARLNPDIGGYNDYDQLMRLDEWQARGEGQS
jgi:ATP-dependent helicase/nuclease subunit B